MQGIGFRILRTAGTAGRLPRGLQVQLPSSCGQDSHVALQQPHEAWSSGQQ